MPHFLHKYCLLLCLPQYKRFNASIPPPPPPPSPPLNYVHHNYLVNSLLMCMYVCRYMVHIHTYMYVQHRKATKHICTHNSCVLIHIHIHIHTYTYMYMNIERPQNTCIHIIVVYLNIHVHSTYLHVHTYHVHVHVHNFQLTVKPCMLTGKVAEKRRTCFSLGRKEMILSSGRWESMDSIDSSLSAYVRVRTYMYAQSNKKKKKVYNLVGHLFISTCDCRAKIAMKSVWTLSISI